ncbi:NAD(P)-binding protein [Pseudovirgaria hyperparasitica]|uniref:GDP-mannose 4,6-dehydratase n=1 Tax=Pseudovirgaria hyperparasitica TaxID=470096 RepID=A0A6A6W5S1_9PEZI|nr:NAD(P)-binding protein [Pseudovirgaria hyperparasitica]KAF2758232.1 NAD(P)-binding protein [Pseudovirgaria hyperparasitica]
MKKAFITGITGQDGSYLAELLLEHGYEVHGLIRKSTALEGANLENIRHILGKLHLHGGDIMDCPCLIRILNVICPDEIYHLAAQSHVTLSFVMLDYTFQVNQQGTMNLLQSIVICGLEKRIRLYNATTSELFGGTSNETCVLNEGSPFRPQSPYAISKLSTYWLVQNFKKAHGAYAVNGILFNHESGRRGSRFVTKRIAREAARYAQGNAEFPLTLAGVHMSRDWGHARDYVRGIWLMLQQDTPEDLVLATGEGTTVKQFVEAAYDHVGVALRWEGCNDRMVAVDESNSKILVKINPDLRRAVEVECLLGDSSRARQKLGWKPEISLESMVAEMVDAEFLRLTKDAARATAP